MRFIKPVLWTIVGIIALAALILHMQTPRSARAWLPEQSLVATTESDGERLTIYNVRDWTYSEHGPTSMEWKTEIVNPNDVVRVWFLIEPFSDWEAVGHTFLSFEFKDGRSLAFSVEARREAHEQYSAAKGALNQYELIYNWGTERDFVTRRVVMLNHPLRMYPLELPPEAGAALLRSLAEETRTLSAVPRFYNTLTANCTNVLANLVNRHYPDTLPYDPAWHLTGYADEYLMRENFIKLVGSTEDTKTAYDLTPFRAQIADAAGTSPAAYSALLRELLSPN